MPTKVPTVDELREASGEHLAYELNMLLDVVGPFAAERGRLAQLRQRFSLASNVLIESFAIHYRAVAAFLYACDLRPDDITLAAFCSPRSPWALTPQMLKPGPWVVRHRIVGEYYVRASKQVAHLTWERMEPYDDREWDFTEAVHALAPAVRDFAHAADSTRVDDRFLAAVARYSVIPWA